MHIGDEPNLSVKLELLGGLAGKRFKRVAVGAAAVAHLDSHLFLTRYDFLEQVVQRIDSTGSDLLHLDFHS